MPRIQQFDVARHLLTRTPFGLSKNCQTGPGFTIMSCSGQFVSILALRWAGTVNGVGLPFGTRLSACSNRSDPAIMVRTTALMQILGGLQLANRVSGHPFQERCGVASGGEILSVSNIIGRTVICGHRHVKSCYQTLLPPCW